jgi:hypothetical protein
MSRGDRTISAGAITVTAAITAALLTAAALQTPPVPSPLTPCQPGSASALVADTETVNDHAAPTEDGVNERRPRRSQQLVVIVLTDHNGRQLGQVQPAHRRLGD